MRKSILAIVCLMLLLSWIQIGNPMASSVAFAEDIPSLSGVPTNLTANPRNSQADLTWNPPVEGYPVIAYRLYRSTDHAGPFTKIADVLDTKYRDFGLDNGTRYYYQVTSVSIGESAPSTAADVVPMAPLDAPTGLTAISGDGQVTIRWNQVAGALSYDVKRSTENGRNYETVVSGVTDLQYTDSTVSNGTSYYYVVSAASPATASANSASVQVVPVPSGAPAIPDSIQAVAGNAQVILTWREVSGAVSYTVKRGAFGSGQYETIKTGIPGTSFQDAGLVNGVTYDYVISAVNDHGESYHSEPIAVTPADVLVVAKDGTGDFTTIQAALNAVPASNTKRTVIYIRNGVYREQIVVPANKPYVSLVGESATGTILVYHLNVNSKKPDGTPYSTTETVTALVQGKDFSAENMTIQNDSGQGTGQALAGFLSGDRGVYKNIRFLGFQDTIYIDKRQYFKDCYIEGDVDFIYGPATAFFENNELHSNRLKGGYITAASTPETTTYGYVFVNSKITSDPGVNNVVFGRPWRPYAAVAFIDTMIDSSIAPSGWNNWGDPNKEKTARYSEYNSRGPGANPKARAGWSIQLTPEEASQYTVQNVLKGTDNWNLLRTGIIPLTDNTPPVTTLTSYTDGQYLNVNTPTFTWSFSDADAGDAQRAYQVQGSKDNWQTTAWDSGEMVDAATSYQAPMMQDYDNWSIRVRTQDTRGAWSKWAYRTLAIDTAAPTAKVVYSTVAMTNQDVIATIEPDEQVRITNNNGASSYTFSQNGSFTFEFMDRAGNTGTVVASVNNIDKTAPTLHIVLDKTTLLPVNHQLETVNASIYSEDGISGIDSVVLISITSNEPDDGLGDGDQPNDIQGAEYGTPDTSFMLRAERAGTGSGRVYTITYTATDKVGNKTTVSVTATVPRDQSSK
ncbi:MULTISPECIES: pectinesterase family protein [unclassified Paenibacillus]|uniref:pectinesterase family protein n=1 Tax=unclassified Paenibacillus TaxID=185978 RepID=UPI002788DE87|nr:MULTISPECIES: pectinesterase family protein [unclassified Paenibacillus]MDQ0902296.1 pectin methylesterase-like acyl-CoA thioesterase [Paenibacillus sp. V4I7]MDQ0919207.1 pectin methylesterase-like acyl-CoA thioesterase [Paenibacillus sp. V4I5]